MFLRRSAPEMITADQALPGREEPLPIAEKHLVLGTPMKPPFPEGMESIVFAMGCYWGAERFFWQTEGVFTTAVGFDGGFTPNPTYAESCTGMTGHTEAVLVVFDPKVVSLDELFAIFWENHDPTTLHRQGNDIGTQYRSGIYTSSDAQMASAMASRDRYQASLTEKGFGKISTEIAAAGPFYYADDDHQQYLHKNPGGYCNHGFCQVSYV